MALTRSAEQLIGRHVDSVGALDLLLLVHERRDRAGVTRDRKDPRLNPSRRPGPRMATRAGRDLDRQLRNQYPRIRARQPKGRLSDRCVAPTGVRIAYDRATDRANAIW